MTDFALKALNYGVLGLCAVMVVSAAGILYKEQMREGEPRTVLLRYVYSFMVFCLLLAALNAYVQLSQKPFPSDELASLKAQNEKLTADSQEKESALISKNAEIESKERDIREIKTAAKPILDIREGLIDQLPTELPQKQALKECVKQLKQLLK